MQSESRFKSANGNKSIKTNWLNHTSAFEEFSCQEKFLSSAFLFSLSTQKPQPEKVADDMLITRYLFSKVLPVIGMNVCQNALWVSINYIENLRACPNNHVSFRFSSLFPIILVKFEEDRSIFTVLQVFEKCM